MLGVAETVGSMSDFVSLVDKKHRVYAKRPTSRRFDLGVTGFDQRPEKIGIGRIARRAGEAGGGPSELLQEVDRILLSTYVPARARMTASSGTPHFSRHPTPAVGR